MTSSTSCLYSSRELSVPLSWQTAEVRAEFGTETPFGKERNLPATCCFQNYQPHSMQVSLQQTHQLVFYRWAVFFFFEILSWPVYFAAPFQLKCKERAKRISAPLVVANVSQPCKKPGLGGGDGSWRRNRAVVWKHLLCFCLWPVDWSQTVHLPHSWLGS